MLGVKEFYRRVWNEYADPHYHPITAEALKIQSHAVHAWIKDQRPQSILDLGCGPSPVIKPHWAPVVVSADIIPDMLCHLKQKDRFEMVCLDATSLPFKKTVFQLIWAGLLVDHIREPRKWAKEIARVLVPGGTLGLASWQRSCLPPDRYPEGRMCFTVATGEELSVPSYPNWGEILQIFSEIDDRMQIKAFPIVPEQYVLQIAWARIST